MNQAARKMVILRVTHIHNGDGHARLRGHRHNARRRVPVSYTHLELGKALGIKWLSTSLLTNEQLSWIPIVFLAVWQGIAYSVLIYLAGLQTIDDEIYEAAAIDGVNPWQKFWKITFPLIGPFFTINLVLSMKNALGTFDQVVALTRCV